MISINWLVVLILACIFGIVFMTGKFWVYDRCSESELSDLVKEIYILIDVFKDIIFLFVLLRYLLYGV